MIQANESGNTLIGLSSSRPTQQKTSWISRHTQDVSDASVAEFERLMAAMGYRHMEAGAQSSSGAATGGR